MNIPKYRDPMKMRHARKKSGSISPELQALPISFVVMAGGQTKTPSSVSYTVENPIRKNRLVGKKDVSCDELIN